VARVPFVRLAEPPHAHIVCRHCGRISAVDLASEERELLVALASRHPDDWSVDGIAFSLTGACARCRAGPRA
jgi:Fe2+ or Zn2+ uptake regulation protein